MKRLNINLPQELINKIDIIANEKYMNRTELIKQILLEYINRHEAFYF